MVDAYVYYRIDLARGTLAAARIDALLNAMRGHCARAPRRRTRCDDPSTWLEIYEGIADFATFVRALDSASLALGCAEITLGERHLECFAAPDAHP